MSSSNRVARGLERLGHPSFGVRQWLLWLVLSVLLAAWVYGQVRGWQSAKEIAAGSGRLEVLAAALHTELSRHEALPGVLGMDPRLAAALTQAGVAQHLERANQYLRHVQAQSGAEAVYLIDRTGLTIASSNAGDPDSFVGENYAFRPYVIDALKTGFGRFYAIGATTSRPGYFLASAVRQDGAVLGVVAVKVALTAFEASLAAGPWPTLVLEDNGVVILSSDRALRYRSLTPLSDEQRAAIKNTRQFDGEGLQPLLAGTAAPLQVAAQEREIERLIGADHELVSRNIADKGWRVVAFVNTPTAQTFAAVSAAFVLSVGMGCALLLHAVALRRARQHDLREREHEIRRRIEDGTRQLREQIEEQARNAVMLRRTTDSAVQAGKLAVLGQMAAAISHELNQPLTAMHNFAETALVFLGSGQDAAAAGNLRRIVSLCDRMGQIVGHLRSYARKQPGPPSAVDVRSTIDAALQLLRAAQNRAVPISVSVEPPQLMVVARPVRLEQVLLNLLRNALDAQPTQPAGAAPVVSARGVGDKVVIEVRDHGPGLSDEAMAHLFEPFFTTKPSGEGLGLGLAVSKMIVRELGGELSAHKGEERGAVFRVELQRAGAGRARSGVPETAEAQR
ncbi:MAG: sensor histidine kinase [Burkholderiaceae bacterium]|nr:sensor histidine kinase [Burkholderiaceae bacterium]